MSGVSFAPSNASTGSVDSEEIYSKIPLFYLLEFNASLHSFKIHVRVWAAPEAEYRSILIVYVL